MSRRRKIPANRNLGDSPSSSRPTFSSSFLICFPTTDSKKRFDDHFATLPVKLGRKIDFSFLERINFPYLERFNEFGWTNFLKIDTPAPFNIIRAFFSNAKLTFSPNDPCRVIGFETFVMGKSVSIDKDTLAEAFGIRNEGLIEEEVDVPFDFVVKNEKAGDLPMFPRLLHIIISWNLRPFGTKYAHLRRLDKFWLHHIHHIAASKPNLIHFILEDWLRVIKGNVKTIVFPQQLAFLLTKLGVDISCEKGEVPTSKNDINLASLHNIGWYKDNQTGAWVKRRGASPPPPPPADDVDNVMEEPDETAATTAGTSSAPTAPAASLESIMAMLVDMRAEYSSRLDTLRDDLSSRLDTIEQRQEVMFDEFQELRARQDEVLDRVHHPPS